MMVKLSPFPPSTGTQPVHGYIPSLDGIRAFSIGLVFVSHVGYADIVPGGLGVTVFFFLSGYLITTLLRREHEANRRIDYRAFYWRRAWRILPPMYAALAFGLILALLGITKVEPRFWPMAAQAAHLTNYWMIVKGTEGMPAGTSVMWSLAVEEHFYLLFPVCAAFLMRRFRPTMQAGAIVAVWFAILAWRTALVVFFDASESRTYLATDTRLDAILLGCAMGLFLNPSLDTVRVPGRWYRFAIVVASAGTIVMTLAIRDEVFREGLRYSIQTAALAPIFYLAVSCPDDPVFRILNIGWVRFIGTLSYSLYLVHQVIIFAVVEQAPDISPPVLAVVSVPLSLLVAYASYRFVEQPALRFRKKHHSMA